MKSVLISIQPYWVFLIIAKTMGWNISEEKTVEVRKNYPQSEYWDKVAKIYCSKDKKSFDRIPKEYQPLMKQFLGKVIGEFVCDKIIQYPKGCNIAWLMLKSCLNYIDLQFYRGDDLKTIYGWHISNLVIYDKPRELGEFKKHNRTCYYDHLGLATPKCKDCKDCQITRPPQSWCYVESESDTE